MIELKQVNEAHKMLRFYKTTDMNMKKQVEQTKKKISKIAYLIPSYGFSKEISRRAYVDVFKRAVGYTLTSSYMKNEELDKLKQKQQEVSYMQCGIIQIFLE